MFLLIFSGYALLLLVTGFMRRGKTTENFFFADRKLGTIWVSTTLTASWIGAASTLVTIREAASHGYSALWVMAVPTIATLAIFFFFTGTIRRQRFTTLPSLLYRSYGRGVPTAAAWLIFIYMILLTASQLVAWGKLLSSILSLPYFLSVLFAILLITAYSTMGGFFSVVLTDGIQFLLLGGAILLMYLFVGNPTSRNALTALPSTFMADVSRYSLPVISFTLAWVISPIVWQRIAAAKSGGSARKGIFISSVWITGLYLMIIPIGIASSRFPSSSGESFQGMIALLPAWMGAVVFLGLGSAILSTADTALNLAAMTFSLDMIPGQKKGREKSAVRRARLGTILSALLAALIAIQIPSILKTLGLASEIMAEGLFIPGMYALFARRPSPRAGMFALCMGGGFALLSFINSVGFSLPIPEWPASLPWGIGLSLAGFLLGLRIDNRRTPYSAES